MCWKRFVHCRYNFMHVAAKHDNVCIITYLLDLIASDAYWLRLFPSLASSAPGSSMSAAQTRLLLSPNSPMQRSLQKTCVPPLSYDAIASAELVSTSTAAASTGAPAPGATRFPCACDRSRDPATGHLRWILRVIFERHHADSNAAPRIDCVFHERARYLLDLYINILDKTVGSLRESELSALFLLYERLRILICKLT